MPIALLSHTLTTGSPTGGTSPAIDTTGATLLVLYAGSFFSGTTVSDSKGNTWTPLTQQQSGGVAWAQIFYAVSPIVGTGHTFTISSGSATYCGLCAAAFSGVVTASPFDKQSGGTTLSTTVQPGSLTPSNNNSLMILGWSENIGTSPSSVDSGFTITDQSPYVAAVTEGYGMAYLVQTTATAENPTVTNSGANAMSAVMGVFIAASPSFNTLANYLPIMEGGMSAA